MFGTKLLNLVLAGTFLAGSLGFAQVETVYADSDEPIEHPCKGVASEWMQAIKEDSDISADELYEGMKAGKTLPEIAAEFGIDIEGDLTSLMETCSQQAVEDGVWTQDEADEHMQSFMDQMENGFPGRMMQFGRKMGRMEQSEALLSFLGMTGEELKAAIEAGQTLEEIAAEKGLDLGTYALEQAAERIDAAVEAGYLTQEEADERLSEIESQIEAGEFFGKFDMRGGRQGNAELIEEKLGMSMEEIRAALADGKTIRELAEEQGLDLDFEMTENIEERLQTAVENGRMTQEQADSILEKIKNGTFSEKGERNLFLGKAKEGFKGMFDWMRGWSKDK